MAVETPGHAGDPIRTLLTTLSLYGALLLGTGCVHVYQPLEGLQEPVVVDPTQPNLQGMALTVHCIPGDYLDDAENRLLCRRLTALFENQGAVVRTVDTPGVMDDPFANTAFEASSLQDEEEEGAAQATVEDLVVEIRSDQSARQNRTLSWVVCIATLSLVPAVDDRTFVVDVTVRDGEGFLLSEDHLEGRTIVRWGAGVWVANRFMDLVVRDKQDRVFGGRADREVSSDVYQQVSQIVFDAKMRARVLAESAEEGRR